jgi:predicted acyl esterase
MGASRYDLGKTYIAHPLDDDYYKAMAPDWSRVKVPILSAANWGGQGLHPRGNFEGFVRAASQEKWLEAHGLEHWTHFYTDYGVALQKRFFGHFLKGERNGWERQPRVQLQVRHIDRFVERHENEWPIARTRWTKLHLHGKTQRLANEPAGSESSVTFDATGDGVTFVSAPIEAETEITGPLAARLLVSTTTEDADLFLVFRVYTPDLREVVFMGAIDPHTPAAQGWLRVSHRRLDAKLSTDYRPYHAHDAREPLVPGEPVPVDVELWPTSIVVPAGHRLALTVRGRDYEYAKSTGARLSNFKNELRGCGPFLHDDPRDRPRAVFGGRTTLHFGPGRESCVLLPVIPPRG